MHYGKILKSIFMLTQNNSSCKEFNQLFSDQHVLDITDGDFMNIIFAIMIYQWVIAKQTYHLNNNL